MTQLVITHDLPMTLELCERAVIMNHGRVVADGPTRELLSDEGLLAANRLEPPFGLVHVDERSLEPGGEAGR
jgi:cobalt/nickel transport system ATP-binding protein